MIQGAVLWKDEHIIALNKPPGLPSQGGSGQGDRHVDGLTGALMFGYKDRPKLVHRLDRDTSGVLLLARTDRVARGLSEALRHRAVRKIYWAAVAGVPHPARRHHQVRPRQGGLAPRREDARRPPARRRRDAGRQAGGHRVHDARQRRRAARLGGAPAGDGPHPPAARPHGRDRPPDPRRRQVRRLGPGQPRRRLGRGRRRRDRPRAAPPRPRRCGRAPDHQGRAEPHRAAAPPHAAHLGPPRLGRAGGPASTPSSRRRHERLGAAPVLDARSRWSPRATAAASASTAGPSARPAARPSRCRPAPSPRPSPPSGRRRASAWTRARCPPPASPTPPSTRCRAPATRWR